MILYLLVLFPAGYTLSGTLGSYDGIRPTCRVTPSLETQKADLKMINSRYFIIDLRNCWGDYFRIYTSNRRFCLEHSAELLLEQKYTTATNFGGKVCEDASRWGQTEHFSHIVNFHFLRTIPTLQPMGLFLCLFIRPLSLPLLCCSVLFL